MNNPGTSKPVTAGLLTLTMGGIAIGMTEFMIMGVLPDLSASLSISIPRAGNLISIYALGVVIGAPLMTVLAGKFPPRKVLIALMGMFTLFNTLFALAPNFPLLLMARFLGGMPHGAFFGMGAVVASRLARPGREARAVSLMFAGLTLANIIGVPLGTYLGHHVSWRLSFGLVAFISLLAAISIKAWLPAVSAPARVSAGDSLRIFRKKEIWLIIGISAIGTGGLFTWISYIAPLMIEVAGIQPGNITWIMIIAGLGMAAGNLLGGRLADRYSPLKTTATLLLLMVLSLFLVAAFSAYTGPAIVLSFVTGAIAFAVIAPLQMLMIKAATGSEMLASSTLQASANMGNALGAFLGGLPIAAGFGYTSPEWVGAGLAFTGFLLCLALAGKSSRTSLRTMAGWAVSISNPYTYRLTNKSKKEKQHEDLFQ